MGGISMSMAPYLYGTKSSFFNSSGNLIAPTGEDSIITTSGNKIKSLMDAGKLSVNKVEKTFSFGNADFDSIWKNFLSTIGGHPDVEVFRDVLSQATQPYMNAYKDLVSKGFKPDSTAVQFYNKASLTEDQFRAKEKASLISQGNPNATYDVYKTKDGWVTTDPKAKPTESSAPDAVNRQPNRRRAEKSTRNAGEARRVGDAPTTFLGLQINTSKPSILGE